MMTSCLAQVFIVSSSMDCSNRTVLCEICILRFKNKNDFIETARIKLLEKLFYIDQSLKVIVQLGRLTVSIQFGLALWLCSTEIIHSI